MKRLIVVIITLFVLLPSIMVQTETQKNLSPFVPVPLIKAGFVNSVFYKEAERERFSIWNYQNTFNRNSYIVDTDFNIIKQTPDLNGRFYYDGKKYIEQVYSPNDRAPDTTSLLMMDGNQYYIPNGWNVYPLENVCAILKNKSVEFYNLDTVTPLASFDIDGPTSQPIVLGGGRFSVVMYKYGTKLLDLTKGTELCDIKSNMWWDAGNGILASPSYIVNLLTGESYDISSQGLDPLTPLSIKRDYVEYCSEMSEEFINRTIDISYASTLETRMMDNCEVPPTKEGEIHQLREYSQFMKNTSKSYHCLLLTEPTGDIIGFTEGTIPQENPDVFDQGMTMVWKHQRGKGYGKFLKASMLDYVRKNHPGIRKISTGNNDLNAPMLAINEKLGFESVRQIKVYRIDVRKALEKLKM